MYTCTRACSLIYIRTPMGVEHSGEGIFSRRSHNAKLFERIEHSGSRLGIKKCKQTDAAAAVAA